MGRDEVASLALDRLDDDAGDFVSGNDGAEQLVFDKADAAHGVIIGADAFRTAIRIGKVRMIDAGNQRAEPFALYDFTAGERKRAQSSSMKGPGEGNEFVASRVVASQFHGGFGGFGARVSEIHAMRAGARSN